MTKRSRRPWLNYALGTLCVTAAVLAYLSIGAVAPQAANNRRVVTVAKGIVQSTVSGSGNLRAGTELDLGFKGAGTVTHISVKEGQHVIAGQLLATLDPQSAEATLQQARAALQAAQATLVQEEESGGETSTAATTTPSSGKSGATAAPESSTQSKPSAAVLEANLASARAAVSSDAVAVKNDEQALHDTGLYAPSSGTIVSLGGAVGESVAGGGTTRATGSTTAAASSGTSAGAGAAAGSSTGTSAAGSSSGSSTSSSPFAVLSDLSRMQLVVPLSESEVGSVKAGQTATVTIEALSGKKVAAHVVKVDSLSTSNSGVVSYDVTFQLDQTLPGVKVGMSATGEVVVQQAEGINVPSAAVTGGAVTVIRGGREVRQTVLTGLVGNSSTLILSGLKAGEQISLPVASSSGKTGTAAKVGGRLGGGGLAGGLGGGGLPGGGVAGGKPPGG